MAFGHRTTIIFQNYANQISFEIEFREWNLNLVRVIKFCLLKSVELLMNLLQV